MDGLTVSQLAEHAGVVQRALVPMLERRRAEAREQAFDRSSLAALVRDEHSCCPNLEMSLTLATTVTLEARLPDPEALAIAESLFGPLPADLGSRGARASCADEDRM